MLEEGLKAPEFTLKNSAGEEVSLTDFRGQKVVLYFYPKDNTSGCTLEAQNFRDEHPEFEKINVKVIGVSPDPVASHKKFKDKHELPFTLLADEEKEVVQAYDVWKEKNMYGRKYMGVVRTTYIIDEEGDIQKVFPKVKVKGHTEEVLKALQN